MNYLFKAMLKTTGILIPVILLALLFSAENLSAQTPKTSPSPDPSPVPFPFTTEPTTGPVIITGTGRRSGQPIVMNKVATIHSLDLDKAELIQCASEAKASENCSTDPAISVSTEASDPENDVIIYVYTVTGGKIEGQGANVKWNLSDVKAGTYTITVAVDDGCGIDCAKTMTKFVTVRKCATCPVKCECYAFAVERGAGTIKWGQVVTFSVKVSGGNVNVDKYNWTVTNGKIIEGQGTATIKVNANELAGKMITATVELGGPHECLRICPTVASDSVMVTFK